MYMYRENVLGWDGGVLFDIYAFVRMEMWDAVCINTSVQYRAFVHYHWMTLKPLA